MDVSGGDWRSQLQMESRQRIANYILETLKKHFIFTSQKGLQQLRNIVVRLEEKSYNSATSESNYRRIISLNILILERIIMEEEEQSENQNSKDNSLPSNAVGNGKNPSDPGVRILTQLDELSGRVTQMDAQLEEMDARLTHRLDSIESRLAPADATHRASQLK